MSEEFQLVEIFRDLSLHQYVDTPTRRRDTNQPGLQDLVLINEGGVEDSIDYLSQLGKNDHSVLSFNFNCYVARRQQVSRRFIYEKGDYNKMLWEEWLLELDGMDSMDAQWKYLLGKLRCAELECVSSKMIDKYAEAHKHQRTNTDKLTAEAARNKIECGRDIWKREILSNTKSVRSSGTK